MKIKQLEKRFKKIIQTEYVPDGYLRIDSVSIDNFIEETRITIKGAYGSTLVQHTFELQYPDGSTLDFIAGMFFQQVSQNGE